MFIMNLIIFSLKSEIPTWLYKIIATKTIEIANLKLAY